MFAIGSYAVPQIQSVNPDINIDSFTFPANENAEDNVLNSGVDLLFAVMKESKHKDEVYKVLDFMYQDDTIQIYLDNQSCSLQGRRLYPAVHPGQHEGRY